MFNTAMFHSVILAFLVGCASTPSETPNCEIPSPMVEVAHGVSVPEMPSAVSSTPDSATFDRAGVVTLTQLRIAAETNKTIAEKNSTALEARNVEVNELIECARYMGVWIDVHAEDLNDEKREHFIDNLWHRLLIGLGVLATVL